MIERQTVIKLGKVFNITFSINSVQKRWTGNRSELIDLYDKIGKVLDTVGDNQDGKSIPRKTQ